MKTMETDVIIVAAGPSGLAAAVTVGEAGLSSIVFEKSNTTGGAANMGMGPLGIGTKTQKRQFTEITKDEERRDRSPCGRPDGPYPDREGKRAGF